MSDKSDKFQVVVVDLTRTTRLRVLVPAGMDEDAVARAVEYLYDGATMCGATDEENGNAVILRDSPTANDAEAAGVEPADEVDALTAHAVTAYWRWATNEMGAEEA